MLSHKNYQPHLTYTGQYSDIADEATDLGSNGFGLMFYREASLRDNARWYDPALGRFAQADTIVPGGVQGLDRYAYVNNSPVNYGDPTGHFSEDQINKFLKQKYGKNWESYLNAWKSDNLFWEMLLNAQYDDYLFAPESGLGSGQFTNEGGTFGFSSNSELYQYQGKGPYILEYETSVGHKLRDISFSDYYKAIRSEEKFTTNFFPGTLTASDINIVQPIYDYDSGVPLYTGQNNVIYFSVEASPKLDSGTGIPYLVSIGAKVAGYSNPFSAISAAYYFNNGPLRQQMTIGILTVDTITGHYGWSNFKQSGYNQYQYTSNHGR
jgi:RHS repeat-associated protein